uniref:glutamate-5-semialdehyde dehydrogenase n=1 Tax=Chloropicon primus TaxID=1764295 RepID=A0A7S2SXA3_9CHLO
MADVMAEEARRASRVAQGLDAELRTRALFEIADALEKNEGRILEENAKDLEAAKDMDILPATLQRLKLKDGKIAQLAKGIRSLAESGDPVGRVLRRTQVAEGLQLEQVSAPLGVLLIIFEARPDALPQIAALSIRSGNGLLLKGGKEAAHSNKVIHSVVADAIERAGLPRSLVGLVTSRDEIKDLLSMNHLIDLVIPRGSNQLVTYIQSNTKIPVLGHADGVCHIYVDKEADLSKVLKIVVDSKVDYPAACNAAETVLFHRGCTEGGDSSVVAKSLAALRSEGVKVNGGPKAAKELGLPPAPKPKHEYGDLEVTVEIVESQQEAIDFIHGNGSGHTECIITESQSAADDFLKRVDSACVHHNASTRFSDGFRYGLGAEVSHRKKRVG